MTIGSISQKTVQILSYHELRVGLSPSTTRSDRAERLLSLSLDIVKILHQQSVDPPSIIYDRAGHPKGVGSDSIPKTSPSPSALPNGGNGLNRKTHFPEWEDKRSGAGKDFDWSHGCSTSYLYWYEERNGVLGDGPIRDRFGEQSKESSPLPSHGKEGKSSFSRLPPVRSEILKAWQAFSQRSPGWEVAWDAGLGIVATLDGNSGAIAGTPDEAARTFLTTVRDLFGLPKDLHTLDASPSETTYGAHQVVRYHEVVRSLPVFYRGLELHLTDLGGSANVYLIQSNYVPEEAFDAIRTTPTISMTDAKAIATQDYNQDGQMKELQPAGGAHLAYQFSVGGDTEYVVDAHTGKILYRVGLVSFLDGASSPEIEEWGQDGSLSTPRLGFYIEPDLPPMANRSK